MFETVNLLPKTQLKVRQTNQIVIILKWLSRFLVIFFVLALVGEYGWAAVTNQRIKSTKDRIAAVQAEISEQSDTEGKYLYYQQVLNSATAIIEKRTNFLDSLSELYSRLESGVSIQGVAFTNTTLVFSGRATNVQIFAKTLNNFRQEDENKLFGNMVLQDSNRQPDGSYVFKVEIELLNTPESFGE